MKNTLTLFIIVFTLIGFENEARSQNFSFSGRIYSDTTWVADTIFITDHVRIDSGIRLTILPGTVMVFEGYYHINSYGYIRAEGDINDSIVFMKLNLQNLNDPSTYQGGWNGIRLMPRSVQDTSIFNYCRFEGGKAIMPFTPYYDESEEAKGGLLFCKNCGNLSITNCRFTRSFAKKDGAGIYIYKANIVVISHNEFTYNYAQFLGGGIFSQEAYNLEIENNVFYKNTSFYEDFDVGLTTGQGSAMNVWNGNPSAKCLIRNNIMSNNFSLGGTLVESYLKPRIENNLICNNHGISVTNGHSWSVAHYVGNTIVNNVSYYYLSGIVYTSPNIHIDNCIIWNNFSAYPGNPQVFSLENLPIAIRNSNIMNDIEGEGNINEFPMFVRPTYDVGHTFDGLSADYSLLDESPCVNTGTADTSGLNLSPIDLWGNPRVFGGRIDMGAIENQNVLLYEEALVASSFQVYPNPGYDRLYIVVPVGFENGTFELYDAKGICVLSKQVSSGPAVLYPPHVAAGMYFYRLVNQEKVIASGKWIKTN
jgi:hypothetical protein